MRSATFKSSSKAFGSNTLYDDDDDYDDNNDNNNDSTVLGYQHKALSLLTPIYSPIY
jgi:hypothetical protein